MLLNFRVVVLENSVAFIHVFLGCVLLAVLGHELQVFVLQLPLCGISLSRGMVRCGGYELRGLRHFCVARSYSKDESRNCTIHHFKIRL